MKEGMTLEKAKGMKIGMEQAIALAVQTFEEQTGLYLQGVSIDHQVTTRFGDEKETSIITARALVQV